VLSCRELGVCPRSQLWQTDEGCYRPNGPLDALCKLIGDDMSVSMTSCWVSVSTLIPWENNDFTRSRIYSSYIRSLRNSIDVRPEFLENSLRLVKPQLLSNLSGSILFIVAIARTLSSFTTVKNMELTILGRDSNPQFTDEHKPGRCHFLVAF
jgi:hypothetical protein